MARDFKARGVPIDGIGLQMHCTVDAPPMSGIEENIRRIIELGLEVQIIAEFSRHGRRVAVRCQLSAQACV